MGAERQAEQALVERVLAGDAQAREQLVRDTLPAVRRAIGFMAHNRYPKAQPADMEDAVQHVYLAVFAKDAQVLARWHGNASLRTYLARVAEWAGGRFLKRVVTRGGRFRLDLDAPTDAGTPVDRMPDDGTPVDARLAQGAERERLRAAIQAELSERGQAFYQALFVDELTVAETARREGTNANNVYQWKNRILKVAQRVLAANDYLPQPVRSAPPQDTRGETTTEEPAGDE